MDVMSMLTAHTLPASHNIPSAQSQPTDTTTATKTEEMNIECSCIQLTINKDLWFIQLAQSNSLPQFAIAEPFQHCLISSFLKFVYSVWLSDFCYIWSLPGLNCLPDHMTFACFLSLSLPAWLWFLNCFIKMNCIFSSILALTMGLL